MREGSGHGRLIGGWRALAVAIGALLLTAPAVAADGRDRPYSKVAGVQGFVVPAKHGFRVGALVAARYFPIDGEVPRRVRAELSVLGASESSIAEARDRGSLPAGSGRGAARFVSSTS